MTSGLANASQMRLPHASRTRSPYERTNGLTEKELQLRGNLSVRTARVARPSTAAIHTLLFLGLVAHAIRTPKPKAAPKPPGRHRRPDPARGGHGITWWIYAAIATGYAWLTWRMAVIELPLMVAVGVAATAALAYTAGRNHP